MKIIYSIILIITLFSCHKKINTIVTTITEDSITSIKTIKKDSTLQGSSIDKSINEDSLKLILIGQSKVYYDSLHQVQMQFFRDSLGILHAKCIENNRNFHYEYPEKTTIKHINTVTTNTNTITKLEHKLSFWDKLLIGGLIVIIILLLLSKIFK